MGEAPEIHEILPTSSRGCYQTEFHEGYLRAHTATLIQDGNFQVYPEGNQYTRMYPIRQIQEKLSHSNVTTFYSPVSKCNYFAFLQS